MVLQPVVEIVRLLVGRAGVVGGSYRFASLLVCVELEVRQGIPGILG